MNRSFLVLPVNLNLTSVSIMTSVSTAVEQFVSPTDCFVLAPLCWAG